MQNDQPIVFIDEKNIKNAYCRFAGQKFPVYIGREGAIAEKDKKEGDWKTPYGIFPLRHVYYRPDRGNAPDTDLPVSPITAESGWCDDPERQEYNTYVTLPFEGSHEKMYRDDRLYDLVVEIGHNDSPPVPGMGSAVFLHLKRPEKDYTAGCIGFDDEDLKYILKNIGHNPKIEIRRA